MKRSTFSIIFYLNSSKIKKDGSCPVMGRITVDGSKVQFSMKAGIHPDCWDAQKGRASAKDKVSLVLNRKIDQAKQSAMLIYQDLQESTGFVTAEQIRNKLLGINSKAEMLLQLFEEHNREFEKRVNVDKTKSTLTFYQNTFDHLSDFIKSKFGKSDYPLKQVDISFCKDFSVFLRSEKRLAISTVSKHIVHLKKIVAIAVQQGTILHERIKGYTPEKPQWNYRHISGEELEKLLSTPIHHPSACFVRDMFIFSCFTGLSYIDIYNLKEQHLEEDDNGNLWICIDRQKTGITSIIRLLNIPVQIIEKYRPERKSEKLFNMLSKTGTNSCLRKVEHICNIQHLEFHMARHSFATLICISNGVPIETISHMMGHKSIRTTQIYTEIKNTKIDEEMKKLSKRIDSKQQKLKYAG